MYLSTAANIILIHYIGFRGYVAGCLEEQQKKKKRKKEKRIFFFKLKKRKEKKRRLNVI